VLRLKKLPRNWRCLRFNATIFNCLKICRSKYIKLENCACYGLHYHCLLWYHNIFITAHSSDNLCSLIRHRWLWDGNRSTVVQGIRLKQAQAPVPSQAQQQLQVPTPPLVNTSASKAGVALPSSGSSSSLNVVNSVNSSSNSSNNMTGIGGGTSSISSTSTTNNTIISTSSVTPAAAAAAAAAVVSTVGDANASTGTGTGTMSADVAVPVGETTVGATPTSTV
jgi:hypothetical protein